MYVRITRGRFDPEHAGAVEALTSEVAAATRALPGCLAYQGGVNRNAGTVVAISNWEDLSSAEGAREKLGDLLGRILEVVRLEPGEVFEVTVTA